MAEGLMNLAIVNLKLGEDLDYAAECAEDGYIIMKQVGWLRGQGNCLWALGMALLYADKCEEAVTALSEAARVLSLLNDRRMAAMSYQCLGLLFGKLHRLGEARGAYKRALEIKTGLGKAADVADCTRHMADSLSQWVDPESIQIYQEARKLYLKLDMKQKAAKCLYDIASVKLRMGNSTPQELQAMFGEARMELFAAGDRLNACWAYFHEGFAWVALENYPNALQAYGTAIEAFREYGLQDDVNITEQMMAPLLNFQASLQAQANLDTGQEGGEEQVLQPVITAVSQLELAESESEPVNGH